MTSFKVRDDFIPFMTPNIGEAERRAVDETLRSGWLTTGDRAEEFEHRFAKVVQAESALATNSCTAALHLALQVLDVGHGDEVITTGYTFPATANVIRQVGAVPVFVDVEPDTLNMDMSLVEDAITERTRAVIPVHLAGHPCDMATLMEICDRRGVAVIEDAAHGLGASIDQVSIGGHGNLTAYSFYANKNLTTGEGGMLTGPKELTDKARFYGLFGMTRDARARYGQRGESAWKYECVYPGLKYNMSDIAASIGIKQLDRFDEFQEQRRRIAKFYSNALGNVDGLLLPTERENVQHAWHLYMLRLDEAVLGVSRQEAVEGLQKRNVGCSVHFVPLVRYPIYGTCRVVAHGSETVMEEQFAGEVSIPVSHSLDLKEAQYVADAVLDILAR